MLLFLNELGDLRLIDSGGPTFLYTTAAGAIPIAGPSHDFWESLIENVMHQKN